MDNRRTLSIIAQTSSSSGQRPSRALNGLNEEFNETETDLQTNNLDLNDESSLRRRPSRVSFVRS